MWMFPEKFDKIHRVIAKIDENIAQIKLPLCITRKFQEKSKNFNRLTEAVKKTLYKSLYYFLYLLIKTHQKSTTFKNRKLCGNGGGGKILWGNGE